MRKILAFFLIFFALSAHAGSLDECFQYAGKVFHISPILLKCIADVESHMNQSAVRRNPNGTVDVGIMQINSSWIKTIGWRHWARLKIDACYNIYVGAWILFKCIKRYGYTWRAVGCYNAGLSGGRNDRYTRRVYLTYLEKYYNRENQNN